MAKTNLFITFSVPHLFQSDEKFAVRCKNMNEATEVGSDVYSFDGVKNVRLRKCGEPRNRIIMSYNDYWKYNEWM